MLNTSPVLDLKASQLATCIQITRDKIDLITKAMAAKGRITHATGKTAWYYDPLADALFRLSTSLRQMNAGTLDCHAWRESITFADGVWWDWYDQYPLKKDLPHTALNYTPYRTEAEALRERLRAKYAPVMDKAG